MFAAVLFLTVGGVMVYSALKGISVTDVLKGVTGDVLDPRGGSTFTPGGSSSTGGSGPGILDTENLPGGFPGTPYKGPKAELLARLENVARTQFNLSITSRCRSAAENAAVGGSSTSLHKECRAFDASGRATDMAAFFDYVVEHHRHDVIEVFFDPKGAVKRGFRIPAIGGHDDHVHVGA
jgi:hypothetical protein